MNATLPIDGDEYVHGRRGQRMAGNAALAAVAMPIAAAAARRLHAQSRAMQKLFAFASPSSSSSSPPPAALLVTSLWCPANPLAAAALGAAGGFLEDRHARLAWHDARTSRRAVEPEMWTARTLVPCLALAAGGPFLAWKVLDGELKGCDAALASLEGRPAVAWPFFAVLRPRTPSDAARFEFRYHHVEEGRAGTRAFGGGDGGTAAGNDGAWFLEDCDGAFVWLHLLFCRLWGGFYEVERRSENARWNVF